MKKYKNNFLFAFILTLFLILPNFIMNYFFKNFYIYENKHFFQELIITFVISLLISFTSKKAKLIFSIIFILLEIIQIGFYSYFRSTIMPFHIDLLFSETQDILIAIKNIINIIIIFIFIFLFFIISIYLTIKRFKNMKYSKFATPILIFLLIIFPFVIKKKQKIYIPNYYHLAYLNTLFAINLNLINKFSYNKKKFQPYKIIKVNNGKPIVIVIMGESLNFRYMHLFGYKKENTPYLDSLKKDNNFVYKKAISSGVNTPVCIRNFFYIKREPFNINLITSQKTNLLKLAKENGYKTYWLSSQMPGALTSTILNYADIKKIATDYPTIDDRNLLKDLKKIDFSKKSFIILHFRANHSPYEYYTPKKFWKWNFWQYKNKDYHKYKLYSYIDSILFIDDLIYNIIDYMKKNHHNFVIYYVSDHGEMLGSKEENGKYGHSQLDENCAKIPFFYYSDKYHKNFNKIVYNHYLISKYVANDLGYKIINPNEKGDIYYIQAPGNYHKMIEYNLSNLKFNMEPINE